MPLRLPSGRSLRYPNLRLSVENRVIRQIPIQTASLLSLSRRSLARLR